jgi:hypothetical protein
MKSEYKLITAKSAETLSTEVTQHLKEGWVLNSQAGGMYMAPSDHWHAQPVFWQSVTREVVDSSPALVEG